MIGLECLMSVYKGSRMAAIQLIQSAGAATWLSPARIRIPEQLSEPRSAAGVARQIGLPRQHLSCHLRELEGAGLRKAGRGAPPGQLLGAGCAGGCTELRDQPGGARQARDGSEAG